MRVQKKHDQKNMQINTSKHILNISRAACPQNFLRTDQFKHHSLERTRIDPGKQGSKAEGRVQIQGTLTSWVLQLCSDIQQEQTRLMN